MEHPFAPDLSNKTIEELQETLSGLNSKLMYSYRTGNTALMNQLQMMIESHRNQITKKMDELFSKQNLNTKINIQSDNNR